MDEYTLTPACDSMVASVEEHERLRHGGDPCAWERLNALAFLAHNLGFKSVDPASVWACVARMMEVYEAHNP